MDRDAMIEVLNQLLGREQSGLAARLMESTVFISRASVEGHRIVTRLADATKRHAEALTRLILDLGGTPGPRYADLRLAELHYQELRFLLPRLVQDREELVRAYEAAAPRVAAEPRAAAVVNRILEQHRDELDRLKALVQEKVPTAG